MELYSKCRAPSVGEYGVYHSPVDDVGSEFYRIVIRFTSRVMVEEDGVMVPKYEYEVVKYPEEILEEYPEHKVVRAETVMGPYSSGPLEVYSGEPSFESLIGSNESVRQDLGFQ